MLKARQGQPEAAIYLAFPKALLSWIIQKRDVLQHLPALLRCLVAFERVSRKCPQHLREQ